MRIQEASVASTTWLWRLKGQEAMEPIWILGETLSSTPSVPAQAQLQWVTQSIIPHFLWPSTTTRPPPSPDKGFSSQVWGNQASWTWNKWRRRNTPFPFQSSLVGLFFPNRVTPNWQDFQSYKFPCSQPLLKENLLVNLARVEGGLGCASEKHLTNSYPWAMNQVSLNRFSPIILC